MKITFDSVEEVLEFADRFRPVPNEGQLTPSGIHPAELARVIGRIGDGEKIQAIRLYRAVTGAGLKESKEAVERFSPFQLDTRP